jgi:hypothetical protein
MGHQVTFYLTPEDTALLQERLVPVAPMKILHSRSRAQKPVVVDSLNYLEDGKQWLSLFLVREQDLGDVVMQYVDVQDYWTVDALRSPVIEFTACSFDGKILRRGRASYVEGYHEQDHKWRDKSIQFNLWARLTLEAIKKPLKRYISDYIGPKAQSWLDTSGGKLAPQ